MFTVTRYPHGTFAWLDCSTHGGSDAVRFYAQLMGWQAEPFATEYGIPYTMFRHEGHLVAGLAELPPEMDSIPSAWNNYVSVDDVDALMAEVEANGGQVIQPPFDAGEGSRVALIMDPGGAALGLLQGGGHIGSGIVNTPGAFCWNELVTGDVAGAQAFYGALLGWTFEDDPTAPGYTLIRNRGRRNGNLFSLEQGRPGQSAPGWLPWLSVADIGDVARRATAAGAEIHSGPCDKREAGSLLFMSDPWGAQCYLIQLSAPEPWLEHGS